MIQRKQDYYSPIAGLRCYKQSIEEYRQEIVEPIYTEAYFEEHRPEYEPFIKDECVCCGVAMQNDWENYKRYGNLCHICSGKASYNLRAREELRKDYIREILLNLKTPKNISKQALLFFNLTVKQIERMNNHSIDYLKDYLYSYFRIL